MLIQIGSSWPTEKPGGVPTFFRCFLKELTGQLGGDQVTGYVAGSPELARDTANLVQSLGTLRGRRISRYARIAKTLRPWAARKDVLICSHYLPHILPILPRLNPKNFVFHFHGPAALEARAEGKGKLYCKAVWRLERMVYKRAAYITADSQAFAEIVRDVYGIRHEKVHVVPVTIDLASHPWREKSNRTGEAFRLFCARRLVQRVGVDVLVRAAAILEQQHITFDLKIAGEGPLRENLQSLIEQLGLSHCVKLLGRISDEQLQKEYQHADLSIIPTRELEGFGLVILESLAAGTPVIGTRAGAIPEILEPLGSHFLAKANCETELAERIAYFAKHRDQLPQPQVCRAYVQDRYSPSLIARQHLTLYQRYFGEIFSLHSQVLHFPQQASSPGSQSSAA